MMTGLAAASGRVPVNSVMLYLIFVYVFFTPTFTPWLGSRGAILVNGGILLLGVCLAALNRFRVPLLDGSERTQFLLVACALGYYLLAIAGATAFMSASVLFRDLFEFHKPVLYLLAFVIPFWMLRRESDVVNVERALRNCFVGIVAIASLQLSAVLPIASLYTREFNFGPSRLTAPFGNPYDLAFATSFFVYWYLFRLLHERRLRPFGGLLVAVTLMVLTQSRTAVIVVAGSLLVSVPLVLAISGYPAFRRGRIPAPAVAYGAILALLGLAGYQAYHFLYSRLRYLIGGIEYLYTHGQQSSLDERLRQIGVAIDAASQSFFVALFGNGVSKGVMELLESAYAFFLFRYGILGLLIVFLLPLLVGIRAAASGLSQWRGEGAFLLMAALVWLLSILVASVGSPFTEVPRVSFLYYFMLGFAIRWEALSRRRASDPTPLRVVGPRPSPGTVAAAARSPRGAER